MQYDIYVVRSLIGAWVEAELLSLNKAYYADASKNTNISQFFNVRSSNINNYCKNLIDIGLIYKKISPIFRWVACSIISNKLGIKHLKPIYKDKIAIIKELANFINTFPRYIPNNYGGIFKSPLKILIEVCYNNNYHFAYDELSILFALLCESMGIHTILIINDNNKKVKIGVQAFSVYTDTESQSKRGKKDNYYKYNVIDFSTNPYQITDYDILNNNLIAEFDIMNNININIHNVDIDLVTPFVGKGLAYRNFTNYWKDNQLCEDVNLEWFKDLVKCRIDYLNSDFSFLSTIERNDDKFLVYNKGAETTGAIIALLSNHIANNYSVIRNYIINNLINSEYRMYQAYSRLLYGDKSAIYPILKALFYFTKDRFKYCEEMIGVEQIASPLNILYNDSFFRYILKYDCDDLALLFLTFAESINIKNKYGEKLFTGIVRLAGNADDENKQKFHVYPIIRIDNQETVYDVSSGNYVGWEMNCGNNHLDFEIDNIENYKRFLKTKYNNLYF